MNERFISFLGLLAFLGFAWSFSINRRRFPWRVVIWGLGLQVLFALFILKTGPGGLLFEGAQASVLKLNDFALEGAALVFGPLASEQALQQAFGPATGPLLVVLVSATIILVSALSSLLYHWGILPRVVQGAAWIMRSALRTNGSETFATAANIFIGQTEAPLLIKPYLNGMTRSELMAMMTGGMATIAGGVLAAYSAFGRQAGFPEMAGHLVAALWRRPRALRDGRVRRAPPACRTCAAVSRSFRRRRQSAQAAR